MHTGITINNHHNVNFNHNLDYHAGLVLHHEDIREAYKRLFDASVLAYNQKQPQKSRRIKDYFQSICDSERKHPVYEITISIGSKEKPVLFSLARTILYDYYKTWNERNPNLEIIGAYLHQDKNKFAHIHINYIPVAHGCSRGTETQNSFNKALKQQGFVRQGYKTAPVLWMQHERTILTDLCTQQGLSVYPVAEPQTDDSVIRLKEQVAELGQKKNTLLKELESLSQQEKKLKILKSDIEDAEQMREQIQKNILFWDRELEKTKGKVLSSQQIDNIKLEKKSFSDEFKEVQKMPLQTILDLKATASRVDKLETEYGKLYTKCMELEKELNKRK